MASDPIPLISIRGSHREVGRQIGEAMAPSLRRVISKLGEGLPSGVGWDDALAQSQHYLDPSRVAYPRYVAELEGLAEGAELPFAAVFTAVCEELWEPMAWQRTGNRSQARGCTDLVARGRATLDGSTLIAHTNDLAPESEEDLVILKVRAGDEPEFLGVSVGGLAYSAGFNAAGISLTGNEVTSSDVRPGVPRLLTVRAILAARRLEEALDACLLPQRASSYNNVIADTHGEVYSMEGSATDCEPIYIDGDLLAHANHYISPSMRRFEAAQAENGGSIYRQNRAMRLLRENYGQISPELLRKLLADHANYPGSICKHGIETVTVFGLIVVLDELRAWIGRGRPCETVWFEHQLAPDLPMMSAP